MGKADDDGVAGHRTKEMRVQEALREALRYEMARDSRVFVMGEDVALFRRRLWRHARPDAGIRRESSLGYADLGVGAGGFGASARRSTACDRWWKSNSPIFYRSRWISLPAMRRVIII